MLKLYSKKIPVFQSANMSYDICLMKKIVAEVTKALSNTDIEIIETHHNRKVDAPSGTALLLADSINSVLKDKKEYNFDRLSKREKRSNKEIGFSSIRGGNIVGEHTVRFLEKVKHLKLHTKHTQELYLQKEH